MNNTAKTGLLMAIVAGLIIGVVGFSAMQKKTAENPAMAQNVSPAMMKSSNKAADLRVLLNALDREHVNLASAATRNGFDGNPDFKASAGALDNNSVALSKAIGSVYGADAEKKFLEIWRSHITFFVNYTVAAKKGDQAGMDKAVKDLGGYADAISDLLSGANPNLPREAVHQVIMDHIGLLKGAVDAYGAGNYEESYAKQHAADEQVGTIADTIAGAIVKQYPEKFN